MKITLDASVKEHREIAQLFRNQPCEFKRSISSKSMGGAFVSVMDSPHYPKFVVYRLGDVTTKESVTIDTSEAEMDLRMAIGTDIEFEVYSDGGEEDYFQCKSKLEAIEYCGEIKIDGEWVIPDEIKLCPDYLRLVGVEVED